MNIENFLPPLVGSFSGVVLGFGANYWYQSHKNKEDKKKYKDMIRSEIELIISILEEDTIQILPTDKWTSIINSGSLKLFNVYTELEPLTKLYNQIETYNKQAGWLVYDNINDGIMEQPCIECRKSILRELKQLRDSEWLKPEN